VAGPLFELGDDGGEAPVQRSQRSRPRHRAHAFGKERMREAHAVIAPLHDAGFDGSAQPLSGLRPNRGFEQLNRRIGEGCSRSQCLDRLRWKRTQTHVDETGELRGHRQRFTGSQHVLRIERTRELERIERIPTGHVMQPPQQVAWVDAPEPRLEQAAKCAERQRADVDTTEPLLGEGQCILGNTTREEKRQRLIVHTARRESHC
jgi:hypothetical protein